MKKAKLLRSVISAITIVVLLTSMLTIPSSAAATTPTFDSSKQVDLLPYMSEKTFGAQKDNIDGQRQEISKDENGYDVKLNSQNLNYGVSLVGDDSKVQLVKETGTMYYSFTLDAANDLYASDVSKVYGGPMVAIAYGELFGYKGWFTIRFSAEDGIAIELCDKLGNLIAYLGGNTNAFKKAYPDTGNANRSNIEYKVVIKLDLDGISMWMNDTVVLDDVPFDGHKSHAGADIPVDLQRFALRVHSYGTRTTVHDIRLWADKSDVNTDVVNINTSTPSGTTSVSSGTTSTPASTTSKPASTTSKPSGTTSTPAGTTSVESTESVEGTTNTESQVDTTSKDDSTVGTDDPVYAVVDDIDEDTGFVDITVIVVAVILLLAIASVVVFLVVNRKR